MPLKEPQVLFKNLQEQNFSPLYLFWGEEVFLLEESLSSLKAHLLSESARDFNLNVFFAREDDVDAIRDAALDFPVFAPRRMVVIRQAEAFTEKEWEVLSEVIATPVDSTVLVFIAGEVDKRKKSFKVLLESADCIEFKKPSDQHLVGYIKSLSQRLGCEIKPDAIQLMSRLKGSHLQEIFLELQKLSDFIHPRKTIEALDVQALVSQSRDESVFELIEAVGVRDQAKALLLLIKLLDQGQNEIGIVALVARHMRILLSLKEGQKKGLQGQKLALQAGVPHFFLNKYLAQTKDWAYHHLLQTLEVLAATDFALKSSPLSAHIWLENLVLKVCDLRTQKGQPMMDHLA